MKAGIGPQKMRKQLVDKLDKLDGKIAGLESGIEPFRREREMVLEMLAVHDKHHPRLEVDHGKDEELARQEAGVPPIEAPAMLKVRR